MLWWQSKHGLDCITWENSRNKNVLCPFLALLLWSKPVKALSVLLLMSIIKPSFLNPEERNTLILEATEMSGIWTTRPQWTPPHLFCHSRTFCLPTVFSRISTLHQPSLASWHLPVSLDLCACPRFSQQCIKFAWLFPLRCSGRSQKTVHFYRDKEKARGKLGKLIQQDVFNQSKW